MSQRAAAANLRSTHLWLCANSATTTFRMFDHENAAEPTSLDTQVVYHRVPCRAPSCMAELVRLRAVELALIILITRVALAGVVR